MAESYKFSHWGSTSEDILKSHFPLHRACRDGDIECLSTLLVEAQNGVYVEDSFYGWTAAHWAAYFGKLNCLMRLQEAGSNCDAATLQLNQTPVQIAAFAGQAHCLKWLLHCGARIDRQDYLGETPTHKAARTGSMECSSLLVSHGAKLFIKNISGLSPAELAHNCGHMECSKFMENAAATQENQPRGIYHQQHQEQESTSSITMVASAADVTTSSSRSILTNGSAGNCCNGTEALAGAETTSQDCEMEEDMMNATSQDCSYTDTALSRLFAQPSTANNPTVVTNGDLKGDVTLDPAISTNQMPVAGRKRTREDADENNFKRQRTSVCPSDPQHDIFSSSQIALDRDDQEGFWENGYSRYHQNGGSTHQDENVNPNPAYNAQMLECQIPQMPYKCVALGGHYI